MAKVQYTGEKQCGVLCARLKATHVTCSSNTWDKSFAQPHAPCLWNRSALLLVGVKRLVPSYRGYRENAQCVDIALGH